MPTGINGLRTTVDEDRLEVVYPGDAPEDRHDLLDGFRSLTKQDKIHFLMKLLGTTATNESFLDVPFEWAQVINSYTKKNVRGLIFERDGIFEKYEFYRFMSANFDDQTVIRIVAEILRPYVKPRAQGGYIPMASSS